MLRKTCTLYQISPIVGMQWLKTLVIMSSAAAKGVSMYPKKKTNFHLSGRKEITLNSNASQQGLSQSTQTSRPLSKLEHKFAQLFHPILRSHQLPRISTELAPDVVDGNAHTLTLFHAEDDVIVDDNLETLVA